MRRAGWRGTLGGVALLATAACATSAWVPDHDLLWHPREAVAVPDLSAAGWERVSVDDADLAFSKHGIGVVAARLRCPAPAEGVPLRWEGRQLWLGVPRDQIERFHFDVDGYEGVSMAAQSDGLYLRTATVRTGDCSLDVVQVAPEGVGADLVFDSFMARVRLHREEP